MADLSGLDVGYKIRKGKQLTEESDEGKSNKSFEVGRGRGTRYSRIGDELFLLGRLGVKNGKGFYQYATKKNAANIGRADKVVEGVIECQTIRRNSLLGTAPHSVAPHVLETAVDEGARERVGELITQRLLYPLINEAFKLLEQGGAVSGRPGDIDIVFLKGSNTAKRSYVVYCVFFSLFSPLLFLAFTSFLSYLHSSSLSHFRLWLAKY
jgi:3-hydroxyacyl-CoA dehydrogenase